MKEKKYRVVEEKYYENGEILELFTKYFVEVQKSFLGYKYWSSIKKPSYDTSEIIKFSSLEAAQKFIEKMKECKKASGWKENVVWSDPEFQKIN